jgi:hypothetical protein
MKHVKLSVALTAALLALPFASFAQEAETEEAESPFSWSLTATSD